MLHDGARTPSDADPLSVFLEGWFTRNVNEPFSKATGKIDFEAMCIAAGFRREDLFYGEFEQVYLKGQLPPIPFRGAVRR